MGQAKKNSEEKVDAALPLATKTSQAYLWFVARGFVLKGPYSTGELAKKVEQGEVPAQCFAWRDGYREWRPLYGIDEFQSHVKDVDQIIYPTVPIPGQLAASRLDNPAPALRDIPVYKVRFSRSRIADLKKSEIVSIFLFMMLFAYGVLHYSFEKVQSRFSSLWGAHHAGQVYYVGNLDNAVPVWAVGPALTSPALKVVEHAWLAVRVGGRMDRQDSSQVAGYEIDIPLKAEGILENLNWDEEHVFIRQVQVDAYIDLKHPRKLVVPVAGMPYLPVESPRDQLRESHFDSDIQ